MSSLFEDYSDSSRKNMTKDNTNRVPGLSRASMIKVRISQWITWGLNGNSERTAKGPLETVLMYINAQSARLHWNKPQDL